MDTRYAPVFLSHGSPMTALQPGAAFIMASLLSDVVERGTGVGARAGLPPDLPVLGKTGTTNAAQDVW